MRSPLQQVSAGPQGAAAGLSKVLCLGADAVILPAGVHTWPANCPEGAVSLKVAWRLRRFKLPHKKQLLGLPAGQCLKVKAATFGKAGIEQAFNPVSIETPGEVVLLVKVRPLSRALPPKEVH